MKEPPETEKKDGKAKNEEVEHKKVKMPSKI
jgi:hypothetical protein